MSAHFTAAATARLFGPDGPQPLGPVTAPASEPELLAAALDAAPRATFRLDPPALHLGPTQAAPAFETLTGGTTGAPRHIRRTQASWIASFEVNRAAWSLGAQTRAATLGSLAHSLTLYGALEALHVGGEAHLLHGLRPDRQQQAIARRAITLLWATPSQIRLLFGPPAPGVTRLLIGGGALDAATEAHARRLFPSAQIHSFYGAAETSFITLDGAPYPGVEIEIRNPDVDGTGEVWLRSPYLFEAYATGPDPHRDARGFTTVGERGWLADGTLHLAGRADRAVRIAEQTVQLEEVEAALLALPGVTEAAVLPRPDRARGTRLAAAYAGTSQLEPSALTALPPLARPRSMTRIATEAWPRRPSGKTDLAAIEVLLADEHSKEATP
ncbi:AMP-binding protein [Vannielia litorea]|uniref:AMP-binding protein n=1 Tax=Vannielia litorea TaxID=1217970 RepID=UPI001C938D64|nr:AMP-binding protein [Vannielia litorea]MBY6047995.1 AMP-binding protein [Vannielia litorea]MBY6075409.1 AMP-binding protein [Vannielia litorea]